MNFKLTLSNVGLELFDYSEEPDLDINISYLFECIKLNRNIKTINKLFNVISNHIALMNDDTKNKIDAMYEEFKLELLESILNERAYNVICERLNEHLVFEIENLECIGKITISNSYQGDIVARLNQEQIYEIAILFQAFKQNLTQYPELLNEIDVTNNMLKRLTSLEITLNTIIEIREDKFVRLQKQIIKMGKNIEEYNDYKLINSFLNIFNYFDNLKGDYDFGVIKHNLRSVFIKISSEKIDDMLIINTDSILFKKNVKGSFSITYEAYMFILNSYYFDSLKLPERMKILICVKYGFSTSSNSNMWKCLNMFILFYINILIFLSIQGGLDVDLTDEKQNFKYLTKKRINKISGKIKKLNFPNEIKQYLYLAICEYWFN